MMFRRAEGWEGRLDAVMTRYLSEPFVWGQSDCFFAVGDVIAAMTGGESPMEKYRGKYDSESGAAAMLKKVTGGTVYDPLFSGLQPVCGWNYRASGDVGIYEWEGVQYTGFVGNCGNRFYLRRVDGGLIRIDSDRTARLWRVE